MIEIPENFFKNLSSYEEFRIKCTLIGKEPSSISVIEWMRYIDGYYWFPVGPTGNKSLCFIDKDGNKVEYIDMLSKFDCSYMFLDSFGVSFNTICGNFYCKNNQLTSLEGCPKVVKGSFVCMDNMIESLECCPEKVYGDFICSCNNLTSLEGCPEMVGKSFMCGGNLKLTSLKGCPAIVGGSLSISNTNIYSLKGAPGRVGKDVISFSTQLSKYQIEEYINFLRNPTPDLMDETGHYCPKE